jgi:hypothetical protein
MEIITLQSEEKEGVFSIAKSVKFKDQYEPERIARLL